MKTLKVEMLVLGLVSTNTYVIYNENTREAFIVDPSADAPRIIDLINKLEVRPVAILLTHGHFDHIMAVDELRDRYQIKVYLHEEEDDIASIPEHNCSLDVLGEPFSVKADIFLKDREHISLLGVDWEVILTPGHTKGGCCYYAADEELLLSGDTLFKESYGRCDLYSSSKKAMIHSILDRLFVLPEETLVLPGHGPVTTIKREKKRNIISVYIGRNIDLL